MTIKWSTNEDQSYIGTDENGNRYRRSATPHETVSVVTPDGYKGCSWTARDALAAAMSDKEVACKSWTPLPRGGLRRSLMEAETFFAAFSTEDLIMFVESIRYLIVKSGGMATKSLVEDVLMEHFGGLNREDAHTMTNMAEAANERFFTIGPTRWTSDQWAEPQVGDWPYLENMREPIDRCS